MLDKRYVESGNIGIGLKRERLYALLTSELKTDYFDLQSGGGYEYLISELYKKSTKYVFVGDFLTKTKNHIEAELHEIIWNLETDFMYTFAVLRYGLIESAAIWDHQSLSKLLAANFKIIKETEKKVTAKIRSAIDKKDIHDQLGLTLHPEYGMVKDRDPNLPPNYWLYDQNPRAVGREAYIRDESHPHFEQRIFVEEYKGKSLFRVTLIIDGSELELTRQQFIIKKDKYVAECRSKERDIVRSKPAARKGIKGFRL